MQNVYQFIGGDPLEPTNYRPISVLNILSKVLEKLLHEQLTENLEQNHLIYKHQYGYRKIEATNQLYNAKKKINIV